MKSRRLKAHGSTGDVPIELELGVIPKMLSGTQHLEITMDQCRRLSMNENRDWKEKLGWTDLVAGIILLGGLLRIIKVDEFSTRLDNTTLLYLCAAGSTFLLKHAKTFKFGDLQIELEQIKAEVKEAKIIAGIAEDDSKVNSLPTPETISKSLSVVGDNIIPGTYHDDPWKGVFGGKNISKEIGRELTAEVLPLKDSPGWYSVKLLVSTLPSFSPLTGDVQFFIHDSFKNNKPIVKAIDGFATLRLRAWGAFTVGVIADTGKTKLELDLAELGAAPIEFRSR